MAFQHYDSKLWIVALILFTGLSFALALPALAQAQGSSMWDGLSAPAEKTIIYVAKTGAGPDGISWRRAYTELQSALGVATSDHDIWVATGTYTPGETVSHTFLLTDGVGIYGGFSPEKGVDLFEERDWELFPTVLSGDIKGDDITAKYGVVTTATNIMGENSYHVVVGSSVTKTAVLDGFTITAGKAEGGVVDPCDYQCGGGLYNHSGSPTLVNVNFSGNSAASAGGGMYNLINSSPALNNVSFSGNMAGSGGGGIFNSSSSNPLMTSVTISGNSAGWGGGMLNAASSPALQEVAFTDNAATWGGGMDNNSNSNPTLIDVTFTGNSAGWAGGMFNSGSSPSLMEVDFSDNSADWGGGMYNSSCSPTLITVTFSSNTAIYEGGGMHNLKDSSPMLTHVTFISNTAYDGGGMYNDDSSNPLISYATFVSNTADVGGGMYNNDSSNPLVMYTTFFSNTASSGGGISNWDSSPLLTNVIFAGNVSFDEGGGMSNFTASPELIGVVLSGNSAASNGGGIFNDNSTLTLTNVTISGNYAAWYGGGISNGDSSMDIRNTILWNNLDSSGTGTISATIYNSISTITLTHSLAQGTGGSASWTTDPSFMDAGENLDTDPLFHQDVDPAAAPTTAGDLRLKAESPAINTGDDQYVSGLTTDLDGNPRISGGSVDMGAYESQFYALTVSLAGSGSGSVSVDGFSCATDCTESYADGTAVTLTAIADTGSTFAGWSGACTNTTGDCLVKMTAAKSVTATFTLDQHTLSVSLVGTGSGSVTSDPVGIDCSPALGADCDQVYNYGTVVTLTEAADPGSSFTGWGGACSDNLACVLRMTEPFSVTAGFNTLDLYLPLVSR